MDVKNEKIKPSPCPCEQQMNDISPWARCGKKHCTLSVLMDLFRWISEQKDIAGPRLAQNAVPQNAAKRSHPIPPAPSGTGISTPNPPRPFKQPRTSGSGGPGAVLGVLDLLSVRSDSMERQLLLMAMQRMNIAGDVTFQQHADVISDAVAAFKPLSSSELHWTPEITFAPEFLKDIQTFAESVHSEDSMDVGNLLHWYSEKSLNGDTQNQAHVIWLVDNYEVVPISGIPKDDGFTFGKYVDKKNFQLPVDKSDRVEDTIKNPLNVIGQLWVPVSKQGRTIAKELLDRMINSNVRTLKASVEELVVRDLSNGWSYVIPHKSTLVGLGQRCGFVHSENADNGPCQIR